MSAVRILIADDSQEWREFISYLLRKDRRFEIVGEARDGSHALQLAAQERPTLILLDVRMPGLNGLDAARQILALEPKPIIIFVTGEAEHDVVSAALEIGASGYVLKPNVNRDLPLAIDSAINGRRFVSESLLPDSSAETDSVEEDEDDKEDGTPQAANAQPIKFLCAQYCE